MPDLADGETAEVQGSAKDPYLLKNSGGVYSCTCPAWRNQSIAIEKRTCKHLRKFRGEAAEIERLGNVLPGKPIKVKAAGGAEGDEPEAEGPPLLLAHTWTNDVDLTGWWMSEKLDGVRAFWDGKQFISRLGNVFHAPDWFKQALPDMPLDGELWLDRKSFQRTISIVRRQDKSDHWHEIKYLVFDAPAVNDVFERRVEAVRDAVARKPVDFILAHEHIRCLGVSHLEEELARMESVGGEGLMLREPGSKYIAGRSSTLLKVKKFYDAEAHVLEHQPGAGRHKGRLGALLVQMADGTKFSVGTGFSDAQRNQPPAIGSTITFRYQELTDRGVPRFPSFVGLRSDAAPSLLLPQTAQPAGLAKKVSQGTKAQAAADKKLEAPSGPAESPATGVQSPRYFEFSDGKSSKFWELSIVGTEVRTRYGKIGAAGQTTVKSFATGAAALAYAEKLIDEKTEKGYEEAEPSEAPAAAATPSKSPSPSSAKPAASKKKDEEEEEAEDEAEEETPAASAASGVIRRYFEFEDDTASKFWEIKVAGKDVTVRFGRIGTNGQSKVKSFPSPAAATAHAEKLIEEKTEKGYEETD